MIRLTTPAFVPIEQVENHENKIQNLVQQMQNDNSYQAPQKKKYGSGFRISEPK